MILKIRNHLEANSKVAKDKQLLDFFVKIWEVCNSIHCKPKKFSEDFLFSLSFLYNGQLLNHSLNNSSLKRKFHYSKNPLLKVKQISFWETNFPGVPSEHLWRLPRVILWERTSEGTWVLGIPRTLDTFGGTGQHVLTWIFLIMHRKRFFTYLVLFWFPSIFTLLLHNFW